MQICYIKYNNYSPDKFLKEQAKKEINKVSDPRKRAMLCACISIIALQNINQLYANTLDMDKFKVRVDSKGYQMLSLIQTIGYWIAIVSCAIEVVKEIRKQNVPGIFSIAFKYATMYGLLYGLPWFFDLIKDLFS